MQDKASRVFRVKAVAEMYDVSVPTIYRAIKSGQLDSYRIGAGKGAIRIPEWALGRFEESCVLVPRDAVKDHVAEANDTTSGEVSV